MLNFRTIRSRAGPNEQQDLENSHEQQDLENSHEQQDLEQRKKDFNAQSLTRKIQ